MLIFRSNFKSIVRAFNQRKKSVKGCYFEFWLILAFQCCYCRVFQNERNVRPIYKYRGNGNDNQFCIDWDCLPVKYK